MNAEREVLNGNPMQGQSVASSDALHQRANNVDLLSTLWRWKWLVLLGLIIGMTTGYLVVIQLAPRYTSHAMVQILTPTQQHTSDSQLDLGETASSETRQDEIRIMRGNRVIENAIRIGKLDQNAIFVGKPMPEIIDWISNDKRLVIEPGTKENKTDLIDLYFECEDKEFSAEVLQAILAGYQKYLTDTYSNRGTEVFDKLAEYRDQYDQRYIKLREQYMKRSAETNLVWEKDELKNPFAEALAALAKTVTEVNTEANHIDAIMKQVETAIAAGRKPEALLPLLEKEIGQLDRARIESTLESIQKNNVLYGSSNSQMSELRQQILTQQIERDKAETIYGPKHRSVAALDLGIQTLKGEYESLKQSDEERKLKLQEDLIERFSGAQTPQERLSVAIAALSERRQSITTELELLNTRVNEQSVKAKQLQMQLAELQMLDREMDIFEENATELKKLIQSLQVGSDYNRKRMTPHIEPAMGARSGPSYLKFLGLGGVLGGLSFFGLAYLLEMADRSYRSPEEILRSINIPVLGHIPVFEVDRRELRDPNVDSSVVTLHKPQSNTSECYRGIRTSLFFANKKDSTRLIQVTSPLPGDGKSTLASNIAVSLAQSGRKVLLVDADLRRPRGAKIFGVKDDIGLSSCIADSVSIEDAVRETIVPGLWVMSSGPRVANPSELLVSPEFEELLHKLRAAYEFVVIDTPPILSVSDPASIAPLVDAVILTMRLRRNSRPIAEQTKHILDSVDAKVVGIVINGVDSKNNYGYGGYRYDTSGMAGYSYANKSYGYGGSGKVYGDEQMQTIARVRTERSRRAK
jgi:capsular exopolysaccharide synthesis family protein